MGKYKVKPTIAEDNSNGILLANCLNSIANELAEANRLKRLEIKYNVNVRCIGKELEDQA